MDVREIQELIVEKLQLSPKIETAEVVGREGSLDTAVYVETVDGDECFVQVIPA